MKVHDISQARAFELLSYCPEKGVFTWKTSRGKVAAGAVAGTIQAGYRKVTIDKMQIKLHRLAWFMTKGVWPAGQIDHINGDKLDNSIANLRDVPQSVNMQNRLSKSRKSGLPAGVRKLAEHRFAANIQVGVYPTSEEAGDAYLRAKRLIHEGGSY